uniref:Uncharacterized protein n=1 Tax=Phytophthora fragariae TaxID=53985 RepID=A0A6A3DT21_9STRA|nr:hypothetical protein PF009_g28766 [Phytophthora fragariae]
MIKKKKTIDQPEELPAWAAEVSKESAEPIMEHEEDEQLSREDRDQMDTLRDLAVDEMETYLNDTIVNLGRNETNAFASAVDALQRDSGRSVPA